MEEIDNIQYITSNDVKFKVAERVFQNTGIRLVQKSLTTPEIQSTKVEEVAEYSARWTSNQLKAPVVLTDAGFYISALKGFPGPFVKYINDWLSADDILSLMKDKDDRYAVFEDCLAYCQPGEEPIIFKGMYNGTLSITKGEKGGTTIDQIFIPQGFKIPISEIPADEMLEYWGNIGIWKQFKRYLMDRR
ncbi:MAG: non-canonical purine NTP pyrophosphatase [Ruminiclostridium sp.]|nr:non-canonical purine NTP pyrophosphatase [Ruminiclostridium sp.]